MPNPNQEGVGQIQVSRGKLQNQNSSPTGKERKDDHPAKRNCRNFCKPLHKISRDPHMNSESTKYIKRKKTKTKFITNHLERELKIRKTKKYTAL